ncbi:MAG: SDR family NAD(P)-dependent oxidoreductase [Actinomycetota bacterium]
MQDLDGKTAVITGGASGIGLAMAHRFGTAGMRLLIADIEAPALDRAAAELRDAGHEVATSVTDVADLAQIEALAAVAADTFGNVHLLCNNAGVGGGGSLLTPDGDLALWKWTIDIDLWGVIYGCKVFGPAMAAHGEGAHIVNTASMAGLGAPPFMGAYTVAKYGVVALSESLCREAQALGTDLGVSVLCPAFVATAIADSTRNLPDDIPAPTSQDGEFGDVGRQLVAAGMPPAQVADAVHHAVVANEFWILTHDEGRAAVKTRAREIVESVNPGLAGMFE